MSGLDDADNMINTSTDGTISAALVKRMLIYYQGKHGEKDRHVGGGGETNLCG